MTRTPTTRLALVGAGLLLAAATATGCSSSDGSASSASSSSVPSADASSSAPSSSSTPSSGASSDAQPVMITIKEYKYSSPGKVAPGTEIMVMNEDSEAHTVTADSKGGFDVTIAPGKSATFKAPSSPGSYDFHCTYHSNMHGTLTVG